MNDLFKQQREPYYKIAKAVISKMISKRSQLIWGAGGIKFLTLIIQSSSELKSAHIVKCQFTENMILELITGSSVIRAAARDILLSFYRPCFLSLHMTTFNLCLPYDIRATLQVNQPNERLRLKWSPFWGDSRIEKKTPSTI